MTAEATVIPGWPSCGVSRSSLRHDSADCPGRVVEPYNECLAHLRSADREEYLVALHPGDDIDHRGTTFSEELLGELLAALRGPTGSFPTCGVTRFDHAVFAGWASFAGATFTGNAYFEKAVFRSESFFDRVVFTQDAQFIEAEFSGDSHFISARFSGDAWFGGASFGKSAQFSEVRVAKNTSFRGVAFGSDAWFSKAEFLGGVLLQDAEFEGEARFDRATFHSITELDGVKLAGNSRFDQARFLKALTVNDATFDGATSFKDAVFHGDVEFKRTTFAYDSQYVGAKFHGDAGFQESTFASRAMFGGAEFDGGAWFFAVRFSGPALFQWSLFRGDVRFHSAQFDASANLGPLECAGTLDLSFATFQHPPMVRASTDRLECRRTRWASSSVLQLRYATVDLSDSVIEFPLSITASSVPFTDINGPVSERIFDGTDPAVRMDSIQGVDAAHLMLHDVDLTQCTFSGTVHLDQLQLEGRCPLAVAPSGIRRRGRLPIRWTPRRTLAEEQHWRHARGESGWAAALEGVRIIEPAALAPVYRQLRKSFEDGKNEPDAADFYYGEMEMRRKDVERPYAERGLLTAYWALSGYGLRASRAVSWLLVAMTATVLAMMLWGVPKDDPKPESRGRITGSSVSMTTDTPNAVNPAGSPLDRMTSERLEKSLRVVINSVVFRSSGENLTTFGTYAEMASRIGEPVLLGLAILAVRGRVKR